MSFTDKDYTVILNKPELKIGMDVVCSGDKGKIIDVTGRSLGDDYCMVELEKPDKHNCTIIEVKKSIFNFLIYP